MKTFVVSGSVSVSEDFEYYIEAETAKEAIEKTKTEVEWEFGRFATILDIDAVADEVE